MKYYSLHRPVAPGSFPKNGNVVEIHNFDDRQMVPEIGREAWGWIEYSAPLTDKEMSTYELVSGEARLWYPVAMSVWDDGHVVPPTLMDPEEYAVKPENKVTELRNRTLYVDWFDTREEAIQFIKENKEALFDE